jgi:internalin A
MQNLLRYSPIFVVLGVVSLSGCARNDAIPKNIVSSQREAARQLAALGAQLRTSNNGSIIEVKFFSDPDANNPKVCDDEIVCLSNLPDLEVIDLQRTDVTDSGLRVLTSLTKLRSLALPRSITDRGMVMVADLRSLVCLEMWACAITDDGLSDLENLTNIEYLNLADTKITGKGLRHLSRMENLVFLGLDGTAVAGEGIESLNTLPSLRELKLGHTRIADQDLAAIVPTLRRLECLTLNSTAITDNGLSQLREAIRLKKLWLMNTAVTDAGLGFISKLVSLQELALNDTAVGDACIVQLQNLHTLREIFLANTAVSKDGIVGLRRKLPGVTILQ